MKKLSSVELMVFEKLFNMQSGYVLNFSNRTFDQFIFESVGINVRDEHYINNVEQTMYSSSKANILRYFWNSPAVYSFHLFLISSSVSITSFLSLLCPSLHGMLCWCFFLIYLFNHLSFIIIIIIFFYFTILYWLMYVSNFLKEISSLPHSIVFLYIFTFFT